MAETRKSPLLLGYLFTQPGKKMMFMGDEFGQWQEWNHERSLDWHLTSDPAHAGVQNWVRDLNRVYRNEPALHQADPHPQGFEWVDCCDAEQSTISWLRSGASPLTWQSRSAISPRWYGATIASGSLRGGMARIAQQRRESLRRQRPGKLWRDAHCTFREPRPIGDIGLDPAAAGLALLEMGGGQRMRLALRLGANYLGQGRCAFRVWAPHASSVDLHLIAPEDREVLLRPSGSGYWSGVVDQVQPGARYFYELNGGSERPDPASRFQPEGVHGPSAVVDPAFNWTDQGWFGRPLRDYIIYELHVGTFTAEGTFDSIIRSFPASRSWA